MTQHHVVFVPSATMNHLQTVGHNARNVTGGFMTAVDRLIQHSATFASHSSVTVTAKQTSCEIHSTVSNYKLPPMFH